MLHQPTIEKPVAMHLEPMVAWRNFERDQDADQLSFEEKLSLMVDRLWTWRQRATPAWKTSTTAPPAVWSAH